MENQGLPKAKVGANDPSVVLFLGLYLLLLALFIMLNSISTIDEERSAQAVDSVGEAFSELLPSQFRSENDLIAQGAVVATDTFKGELTAALASILAVSEVESLGGNQLRVETDVESLFDESEEAFNDDASVFLDRIGRVFRRTEEGQRRELEIIIGVGDQLPEQVDAESNQALRQVARFTSELIDRNVPENLMSIGLSPGDEGGIVMFFNSRAIETEAEAEPETGSETETGPEAETGIEPRAEPDAETQDSDDPAEGESQ